MVDVALFALKSEQRNPHGNEAAELFAISKRVMNYKVKMHGTQNKRWRRGK